MDENVIEEYIHILLEKIRKRTGVNMILDKEIPSIAVQLRDGTLEIQKDGDLSDLANFLEGIEYALSSLLQKKDSENFLVSSMK